MRRHLTRADLDAPGNGPLFTVMRAYHRALPGGTRRGSPPGTT